MAHRPFMATQTAGGIRTGLLIAMLEKYQSRQLFLMIGQRPTQQGSETKSLS